MSLNKRKYLTLDYPSGVEGGATLLTGIRQFKKKNYITGFYKMDDGTTSFIYKFKPSKLKCGKLTSGKWYPLNYSIPGAVVKTSLYGPNILCKGTVRAVGNISSQSLGSTGPYGPITISAILYQGNLCGKGIWKVLDPAPEYSGLEGYSAIAHSTMGDLVVGNFTYPDADGTLRAESFVYNIATDTYDLLNIGVTFTAYGIWHNGNSSYTICGGSVETIGEVGSGAIFDYDSVTKIISNTQFYKYENSTNETHFNGITSDGCGGYNLCGDSADLDLVVTAFAVNIGRKADSSFETDPLWIDISYPDSFSTSANSIVKSTVIGVYVATDLIGETIHGYVSYQ